MENPRRHLPALVATRLGAALALGTGYSCAEVLLGSWLRDLLHLERNPNDRIDHPVC